MSYIHVCTFKESQTPAQIVFFLLFLMGMARVVPIWIGWNPTEQNIMTIEIKHYVFYKFTNILMLQLT